MYIYCKKYIRKDLNDSKHRQVPEILRITANYIILIAQQFPESVLTKPDEENHRVVTNDT